MGILGKRLCPSNQDTKERETKEETKDQTIQTAKETTSGTSNKNQTRKASCSISESIGAQKELKSEYFPFKLDQIRFNPDDIIAAKESVKFFVLTGVRIMKYFDANDGQFHCPNCPVQTGSWSVFIDHLRKDEMTIDEYSGNLKLKSKEVQK